MTVHCVKEPGIEGDWTGCYLVVVRTRGETIIIGKVWREGSFGWAVEIVSDAPSCGGFSHRRAAVAYLVKHHGVN